MRALIQRVTKASVTIDDQLFSQIDHGFLVLLGVCNEDGPEEVEHLWHKISKLRICADADGRTNISLKETGGSLLVVSQFTLYASCKKGNRPSFGQAGDPQHAKELYEAFVSRAREDIEQVQTGEFGAYMQVELVNDGPFTIWLDTDEL